MWLYCTVHHFYPHNPNTPVNQTGGWDLNSIQTLRNPAAGRFSNDAKLCLSFFSLMYTYSMPHTMAEEKSAALALADNYIGCGHSCQQSTYRPPHSMYVLYSGQVSFTIPGVARIINNKQYIMEQGAGITISRAHSQYCHYGGSGRGQQRLLPSF